MQSMYELVGDRIQEIFDAQVVDIGIVDREANQIHYPYTIERGYGFRIYRSISAPDPLPMCWRPANRC